MKQPETHQEKIEWYSVLHKQNLNGRETEDELFELGISAGIEETEELQDEFAIEFTEWKDDNFSMYGDKTYYAKTSSQYFDITKYAGKEKPTKYYITKELLEIYKKTL